MSRLLRVELDRFASRTLIRLGVLGVLVICCLAVVSAWQSASPPSQAEQAQAQEYYEQALAEWDENGEQIVADCQEGEDAEKETSADPDAVDWQCESQGPRLENWLGSPPSFDADTTSLLGAMSVLFVLAPLLLAGSFVSAEFSTGSIGNWLTFAPRRVRVYLSKVLAAGLAIIPVTAVAVGLVLGGSWLAYRHFDTLDAAAAGSDGSSPVARRAAHRRPRTGDRRDRRRSRVPRAAHRGGARDRARVARPGRGDPGQPGAEPAAVDADDERLGVGPGRDRLLHHARARRRRRGSRASTPRTSCRRPTRPSTWGSWHSSSPSRRSWSSAAATSADPLSDPRVGADEIVGSVRERGCEPTVSGRPTISRRARRVRQSARGGGPGACPSGSPAPPPGPPGGRRTPPGRRRRPRPGRGRARGRRGRSRPGCAR